MILLVNLINYLEIMDKYNWFENHEGELGFTVRHTEGDKETLIAVTDSAEKAHLITTMLNNQVDKELIPAEELLKPYYKQNNNGLEEWIDYEDALKVLEHQQTQFHLLKQLYDAAIMQWKEADRQAHDLDILVTAKQNEITRLHDDCHVYKADINKLIEASKLHREAVVSYDNMVQTFTEEVLDLRKQVTLKELSNAALLIENRDLKNWKESQLANSPDLQAISKLIGVPLGQPISDKIIPYIEKLRDVLFPGAFLWWVHINGWHKHSSGEYYYKSKDFHQWPPDEAKELDALKVEFKALYNL